MARGVRGLSNWTAAPGAAPAIDRKNGFAEVIGANPKLKVIRSQTGDFTRAKGKEVMEAFLKSEGKNINVLYAHNDDMAIGAIQAIEEAGLKPGKDIVIVSIDGGCPGVQNVADGVIGATSMQFPLLMASMGVEAVKKFAETGEMPETPAGQEFVNTGVELVTDDPVEGIPSITSEEALEKCWG